MQILLYDDKEMHIYEVVDVNSVSTGFSVSELPRITYEAEISTYEVKAELDPTTMKRIAKYNLDEEFEEINSKIIKTREELLRLDKEVDEKREKILLLDNLIEMIWKDEDFDEDKYLPDEED